MAPQRDGARFDRAIDNLEFHNRRLDRLRAVFPSFKKIFLVVCLAGLSWFATYVGMLELIAANTGDVPLVHKIAIGFAVATLMLMVLYILDALFSPISWWLRLLYILGYVLLTLISVGFGFGFYWKVLESRGEATRSAEAAISQVQRALEEGKARIGQLGGTLDTLTAVSAAKATEEREKGLTCPDSPPGDGPRRRMRDADAKNFAFTSDFIKSRAGGVQTDLDALNADLAKVLSRDPSTFDASGTRNEFLRALNGRLDLTITRFNALRSDPQLAEQRNALAERADRTSFGDGKSVFACPDPQLQTALHGVVRAIDSLPSIEKPNIAAVEGSEAIVEAFRRLTVTTVGALQLKLPPSPEALRELQRQAVQQAANPEEAQALMAQEPGLGPRDYIPLFIAIFVDFCLLLVSINRPINRFHVLVQTVRDARDGPVGEILARFHETHLIGLRREFEVFQHAVFDFLGDYYVAVPINAQRTEARYLANLFVGLEGKGIVDRVLLPPAFVVRRKLKLQGSAFAQERAFRLYRFRTGAWSKLVLDAILGAGPRLPAERQQGVKPAELQAKSNGHTAPEAQAKTNGAADGANGKHETQERSLGGQLEAATALDPEDAARRPASPTPEAKAANGHKKAEA
ncbi:MAG TPA: hypothetical protein DIC31_05500 [Rhizobiales bacterium]|nr:hypothetical protein [Hyphomicrobiales bacterium]HBR27426.1 hypothetical protein [Hyphomicrobiales bacterium]HCL61923.1 hypothetical protein [Hyphomicrobiales bacterium]